MLKDSSTTDIFDAVNKFFVKANPSMLPNLKRINDFAESDSFRVCVAGGFSRGKSHFINMLTGTDFLPESAVPTTGYLTEMVYGEQPELEIVKQNGSESLPLTKGNLDRFSLYTRKDPGAFFLKIHYPSPFLKKGVIIMDTPGVEDPDGDRSEIAYEALQNADAAIIMISALSPLSLTEREFVAEYMLDRHVPLIAGAVSFLDGLDNEQKRSQLEHIAKRSAELHPDMKLLLNDDNLSQDMPADFVVGVEQVRAFIQAWANLPDLRQRKEQASVQRLLSLLQNEINRQEEKRNLLEGDLTDKQAALKNAILAIDEDSDVIEDLRAEFLNRTETIRENTRHTARKFCDAYIRKSDDQHEDIYLAIRALQEALIEECLKSLQDGVAVIENRLNEIYPVPEGWGLLDDAVFHQIPLTKLPPVKGSLFDSVSLNGGGAVPIWSKLETLGNLWSGLKVNAKSSKSSSWNDFIPDWLLFKGGKPVDLDLLLTGLPVVGGFWPILKPHVYQIVPKIQELLSKRSIADLDREISALSSRMSRGISEDIRRIYQNVFEKIRSRRRSWLASQKELLADSLNLRDLEKRRTEIEKLLQEGKALYINIQQNQGN